MVLTSYAPEPHQRECHISRVLQILDAVQEILEASDILLDDASVKDNHQASTNLFGPPHFAVLSPILLSSLGDSLHTHQQGYYMRDPSVTSSNVAFTFK